MPDVPIVDAHLHLWDLERLPWTIWPSMPGMDRSFGLAELRRDTQGLPIDAFVYVQAEVEPPFARLEARWIAGLAEAEPRIQAIVPWAPLEFGHKTRPLIEELKQVSPLVKGVRRVTESEPDPAFCLRPDFVRGCQLVAELGLLVELCVYHVQLASVTEVVRRCPEVRFVLDHIGKPNIREHVREPWWQDIKAIAALPNVVCKISEIANQADFQSWTIEDLRPYVERALEVFGEDRVMYGAGYPVVLRASSYQRWLDTAETLTSQLSTDGKRKFWGDNARRVYDLPSSVRSAQPEG